MIVPRSILDDGTSPPITEPRHLVEKNNSPHNPATFTKPQRATESKNTTFSIQQQAQKSPHLTGRGLRGHDK